MGKRGMVRFTRFSCLLPSCSSWSSTSSHSPGGLYESIISFTLTKGQLETRHVVILEKFVGLR